MRAKVIAIVSLLIFTISVAHAASQKVLYTFTGGVDGGQPHAGVIFDQSGNLYGVTEYGGLYNEGTVFELSPSPDGWTETVLYNFTGGTDGAVPIGGLIMDAAGNLYGTASGPRCGTVYALSPSGTSWTFFLLRTFTGGKDGCQPQGGLFIDWEGWWYGTTIAGGHNEQGTVFCGGPYTWPLIKGADPRGGVNSWFYGTSYNGGTHGLGTVFHLAIGLRVPRSFTTDKYGYHPIGDLLTQVIDGVNIMDGTTSYGGVHGRGSVYRLTQNQKHPGWVISLLYSFSAPYDGQGPGAGVAADSAGNLYGTTVGGGTSGAGTVFELTPGPPKKEWYETALYNFTGGNDGANPHSAVVLDNAGNLYGTTMSGGAYNQGVVYEIIP